MNFEPVLKRLLNCYHETSSVNITKKHFGDLEASKKELYLMQALGLITVNQAMEGGITFVRLQPQAITYFYDKKNKRLDALKNWPMNILIAFISAVFGAFLARLSLVLFP